MMKILEYKPVIIFALAIFLLFAIIGAGLLNADEDGDEPAKDDSSILGSFFRFVGNVIAFPFRMIGKAFDAIF